MENRIERAGIQINKLNESNHISITDDYFRLKLEELRLTHEYREKIYEEKEHSKEMARLAREEKKLLQDQAAAEKDEKKYEKMLEKAKEEALKSIDMEGHEELQNKVQELERSLQEAHEKKERAKSMAEQTKAGYVYVISNIGSFGESVIKIGMTRRLNPDDRVKELGDASVPFIFDTHAMVYSKNAPTLEKELHERFHQHRVNAVNMRKEFFSISLEDVAGAIREFDSDATFVMDREARDYRETLAIRRLESENASQQSTPETAFPDTL